MEVQSELASVLLLGTCMLIIHTCNAGRLWGCRCPYAREPLVCLNACSMCAMGGGGGRVLNARVCASQRIMMHVIGGGQGGGGASVTMLAHKVCSSSICLGDGSGGLAVACASCVVVAYAATVVGSPLKCVLSVYLFSFQVLAFPLSMLSRAWALNLSAYRGKLLGVSGLLRL